MINVVGFGYGEKKIMLFGIAGVIPLFAYMLFTLIGFPVMGALVFSVLTVPVVVVAGHVLTSQNAWVKAVQSQNPIVIDTNSTGVGRCINVEIANNPFNGGKDIILPDGTRMAYDRAITHLISSPEKGTMVKISIEQEGKQKPYLLTFMPVEEYKNSVWNIDNKTFLFFDSVAGTFLTKPLLGITEKELMSDYITLNELREIRELSKVMREFTRYTFDLIASKLSQLLKSPAVIIILVIVGVIVIGYGLVQVLPQLTSHASTIAQPIAQPLTQSVGTAVQGVVH